MNGHKLDIMRRYNANGNVVKGREFPRHIQVAYGRYIARLCAGISVQHGGLWLRDLPQNLADLCHAVTPKAPFAIIAYRTEVINLVLCGKIDVETANRMPFINGN